MPKKDKKQKDKKRRQRRERKSKLPSSVEALLGYLGKTETTIAPQGNTKPRERAGVDAYDTLHSIIKSQQIQSASYMANLERMAFKTEIGEQIKKQGEESKKALTEATEATKAEVVQSFEKVARAYKKKTEEEKIQERQQSILYQKSLKSGPNPDIVTKAEADILRYRGLIEQKQAFMNPAVVGAELKAPAKAGGGGGGARLRVESAPQASPYEFLPNIDPLQGVAFGGVSVPQALTAGQEVEAGMALMTNAPDAVASSGTPSASGGVALGGTPSKRQSRRKKAEVAKK